MFDQFYAQVPSIEVHIPYVGQFDSAPYMVALGMFVALFVLFKIVHGVLLVRLRHFAARTTSELDDVFVRMAESINTWSYTFVAFVIAVFALSLPNWLDTTLTALLLVVLLFEVVGALTILVDYFAKRVLANNTEDGVPDQNSETAAQMLSLLARILFWVLGFLFVLSNLGIEITSLIAALGIGGIAVGLALQSILGDLFSSFAIYFDKPFKVGDFIIVGENMGTVERIGIKTTRLRALQGEEIVMSNTELTTARIHNYKRMAKRRIVFTLGIIYETPQAVVQQVPQYIAEIFASTKKAELDRAHFASFGAYALNFEVVYYVLASDYNTYMDIQQEVNFKIMEVFEREGIEFAYPTQVLHMQTKVEQKEEQKKK